MFSHSTPRMHIDIKDHFKETKIQPLVTIDFCSVLLLDVFVQFVIIQCWLYGAIVADVDECASNPCQNGGTCSNEQNGFNCKCLRDLYKGPTCDEGELTMDK